MKPISPSLDERVFDATGFEDDPVIQSAQAALRQARVAAERCRDIAGATLANEMMTLPARHREAREKVSRVSHPAVEAGQKTIERLAKAIGESENKLAGPPAPTSAIQQMQVAEVRAALAAMKREQRRLTVIQNLGDPLVAAAALRGPAFLAGLDPEEQQDFVMRWAQANHPGEVNRLDLLRRVHEHVERGARLLIAYTATLTDAKLIADAEALEKAARDAEAG